MDTRAADVKVISTVGFAHGTSHFFHLVIPSLFPWLMPEFGLSFTKAGTLTAGFFVVSGIGQALAGFVVDRYGAQRTLCAGLGLFALAAVALGLAHGYPSLMAAALLAGAGNSVFHPSDYTVLNHRVSQQRLGHAFSVHGLSGNVGWAASPVFIAGISAAAGWRTAAIAAAAVAAIALAAVVILLREKPVEATHHERPAPTFAFLQVGAIWMCFLFFFALTLGFGAIQNFAPSFLHNLYALPLTGAASALSIYLLAGAGGIAAGGFLATKVEAQERLIAIFLVAAAAQSFLLATAVMPSVTVAVLMGSIGFCTGISTPSRDLLVRKVAVARFGQSSFGRVYGFVYSGLDAGLAIAPVVFGPLMDRGLFAGVLFGVAACQLASVVFALGVGQKRAEAAALSRA